jgi:hypothetical protein
MPPQSFTQRITIKHPGYGGNNTLIALPACDGAVGASGKAHYATIHSACTIIANNRKDGWLSASQSGQPRTSPDSEGLIPAGLYFFHVKSSEPASDPYPVVPNFRAWVFPHDDLPPLWHVAAAAQDTVAIQQPATIETCRLTNKRLACENAHIIPAAEKDWFAENEMGRYRELGGRFGRDAADSPANSIRLRRDVHILWDNLFFSIVPKRAQQDGDGDDSDDGIKWCAHTTVEDQELYTDYHNRPVESLAGRAVEYLYARFAWDLFPQVIGFLQGRQPRRLAVRLSSGEVEVRTFSTHECQRFTEGQGRGRSASPTKRSRGLDGQVYEHHNNSAGQGRDNLTAKRKRRSASSGESLLDVDSAVSDVDSSGNPDNALTVHPTSQADHWDLKGWATQQTLCSTYCSDSDRDQSRGRKRCRN